MKKSKKLTKSQVEVLSLYRNKIKKTLDSVNGYLQEAFNEILTYKLYGFADELGIDLANNDWRFEATTNEFVLVPKPEEPKKVIPKKRK